MRIGIVDLDTSHPTAWVPIERELGHEIVGVWDGGTVHPADKAREIAEQLEIPKVYDKMEDMVGEVDCAIIHGCDWDTHVDKARPFVEAGKGVLIDKPMAGKLADLRQFVKWAEDGARIAGGSSLRYCVETQEFLAKPLDERGTPDTVLGGCGVDEFNYGIHAYSLAFGILGAGVESARHLGKGLQRRVQIDWSGGRSAVLVVGDPGSWLPFHASISTEKSVHQFIADNKKLYRALLEVALPYLAGETDTPPTPVTELIEPELAALAARRSWLEGDRVVRIDELSEDDEGYDGAAFGEEYRLKRYPE